MENPYRVGLTDGSPIPRRRIASRRWADLWESFGPIIALAQLALILVGSAGGIIYLWDRFF